MWRALLLLAFLVLAVIVAHHVTDQPLDVEISAGAWQASMPLPVAGLFGGALLVLAAIVALLLRWVFTRGRAIRRWAAGRRRGKGDAAVERALVSLSAGQHATAQREAARASRLLGENTLTLWLTAQAAQAGGDAPRAEAALRRLTLNPEAALIGYRGLAAREAEAGNTEAARALLAEATNLYPDAAALKAVEAELALRAQDWRAALAHARAAPQDAKARTRRAMLATAVAEVEPEAEARRKLLAEAFEADPAFAPGAAAYVRVLEEVGWRRKSRDALREAWRAGPHPALAAVALEAVGREDATAIYERAAALAAERPEHVESALLAGRAAVDAGLWGKARKAVQPALDLGIADRRVHLLLADLAERETEGEAGAAAARRHYRDAAEAPGEPAWRCASCGTAHADWSAACAACGATLSLGWTVAAARAAAAPAGAGLPVVAG